MERFVGKLFKSSRGELLVYQNKTKGEATFYLDGPIFFNKDQIFLCVEIVKINNDDKVLSLHKIFKNTHIMKVLISGKIYYKYIIKNSNKNLLYEQTTIKIGNLFKEQLKEKFNQHMETQGLQFRSLGFNISNDTIKTYMQNNNLSYADLFMLSDEEVGNHLNNMLMLNFTSQTKQYT
jgi:hypothetical protein